MAADQIAKVVADVVKRMVEANEQLKKTQDHQGPPKLLLSPDQMQRVTDEVTSRLETGQFHTLHWSLSECQGMLEKFQDDNKKVHKDLKLIRHVLRDMRERIDDLCKKDQESRGAPVTTDQDAKTEEKKEEKLEVKPPKPT